MEDRCLYCDSVLDEDGVCPVCGGFDDTELIANAPDFDL